MTRGELISFIPLSLKGSEPSIKAEEEVTWKRGGGGNGAFFLQEVKGAETVSRRAHGGDPVRTVAAD